MQPTITDTLDIDATAEKVFAVLTEPQFTRQYMFGCSTVSDWQVGSTLTWEGTFEGKHIVAVTGKILELQKPTRFRYSVFDPNGAYKDVPENYLEVSCVIAARGTGVTLTVTQGDYSKVEDGEKRYQDTLGGWPQILKQIKAIAEG